MEADFSIDMSLYPAESNDTFSSWSTLSASTSAVYRTFYQAREMLKNKQYSEASQQCFDILKTGSTDFDLLAKVYRMIASCSYKIGKFDLSAHYYQQEMLMQKLLFNQEEEISAMLKLSHALLTMKEDVKARKICTEAVEKTESKDYVITEKIVVRAKIMLAEILMHLVSKEKDDDSRKKLADELFEVINYPLENCERLGVLPDFVIFLKARTHHYLGDNLDAFKEYRNCIDACRRKKAANEKLVARCQYLQSLIFLDEERPWEVQCFLNKARMSAKSSGDTSEECFYLSELARMCYLTSDYREATQHGLEALAMSRKLCSLRVATQICEYLYRSFEAVSQPSASAYFLCLYSLLVFAEDDRSNLSLSREWMVELVDKHAMSKEDGKIEVDSKYDKSCVFEVCVDVADLADDESWANSRKKLLARINREDVEDDKENKKEPREKESFEEMLARLSGNRMDGQRAAMPVLPPRLSSGPSTIGNKLKTKSKSAKFLPGLLSNLKMGDRKIDREFLNKVLRHKNKSKSRSSVHSGSTAADETYSEIDLDTICSLSQTSDVASISESVEENGR